MQCGRRRALRKIICMSSQPVMWGAPGVNGTLAGVEDARPCEGQQGVRTGGRSLVLGAGILGLHRICRLRLLHRTSTLMTRN